MTRPSLDEQGCQRIHDAALRLLGDVGCVVLDPETLALLEAHGAVVEGECVRFGAELVAQALATAPCASKSASASGSSTTHPTSPRSRSAASWIR